MRQLLLFTTFLFGTLSLSAQRTEVRDVAPFTGIAVSGAMETTVRKGPRRVEIKASPETLERIETRVKNGRLIVQVRQDKWGNKNYKQRGRVEVTIVVPQLDYLAYNGSGSLVTTDRFGGEKLEVALNGTGNLSAEVEARELHLEQNGAGRLAVAGSTERLKISKNGSGSLRAQDLSAATVTLTSNGSGNTQLHASSELTIQANGSGTIKYAGNPRLRSKINGSGSVRQVNR